MFRPLEKFDLCIESCLYFYYRIKGVDKWSQYGKLMLNKTTKKICIFSHDYPFLSWGGKDNVSNESWENYLTYFLDENLLATACLFSSAPQTFLWIGYTVPGTFQNPHIQFVSVLEKSISERSLNVEKSIFTFPSHSAIVAPAGLENNVRVWRHIR